MKRKRKSEQMARTNGDPHGKGQAMRDKIAASQRANRRANRGHGDTTDWGTADPNLIHRLICQLTNEGGAVQFGVTRDGGSFTIRILGDGDPFNEYVRPTEDINLALTGMCEDYEKGWSNSGGIS
jgi:hypothetical protein